MVNMVVGAAWGNFGGGGGGGGSWERRRSPMARARQINHSRLTIGKEHK
jgi:hypothetical protein